MRRWRRRLTRALTRPPYHDVTGDKGWIEPLARAPAHAVVKLRLVIRGWPAGRPTRLAFLSDFHVGSHSDDIARLATIVAEAATHEPDLVLLGGDFVNMMPFGGGRIPPRVIAGHLAKLVAPLGSFAVLGNHDYTYGAQEVAQSLSAHGIVVLDDHRHPVRLGERSIDLIGLPDARRLRKSGRALLAGLSSDRPALVLAHDPFWFSHLPAGPHLMLAGHTHGGQIRIPLVGPLRNASRAPMRWTHGLINEDGRRLYVTSGLGTSGVPLRIGVRPEFAIIDIVGQ